jgi:tetratricopeptide (TPR) repeat protein
LLQTHRPATAVRLALASGRESWDWPSADRLAGACLHLGRPAEARRLWQHALSPPSEAVRLSRVASTFWVERDFDRAVRLYRQARRADPRLVEPCWALAWLQAQLGQADAALRACRAGLRLQPSGGRSDLLALEALLVRYAAPGP